jgi:hypothetical protein
MRHAYSMRRARINGRHASPPPAPSAGVCCQQRQGGRRQGRPHLPRGRRARHAVHWQPVHQPGGQGRLHCAGWARCPQAAAIPGAHAARSRRAQDLVHKRALLSFLAPLAQYTSCCWQLACGWTAAAPTCLRTPSLQPPQQAPPGHDPTGPPAFPCDPQTHPLRLEPRAQPPGYLANDGHDLTFQTAFREGGTPEKPSVALYMAKHPLGWPITPNNVEMQVGRRRGSARGARGRAGAARGSGGGVRGSCG